MGGDYTRLTFEPRNDHAGVLMQQGRVQLDSDWNEQVELLDRRLRVETVDIIGRCVVPRETPQGFRIETPGGGITIGRGRAYVHGLLAENHGGGPSEFDPVFAESPGTEPVDYKGQPYLPDPPPLPSGGPHLAYLDVWQREVTYLEDPDLVEKAIGVDTSTRLQTVWQVKILADVGEGATCGERVGGWDDLTRPSAGRLTTTAVGAPTSDDPCIIPPSGGYRGTENRTYRVEVHDPGPLGTATFKWSRDNASTASPVTGIDAARSELTLARLGRDSVKRIRVDDWVEVTDDLRELAGQPGELRKVGEVDEVRETITLSSPLPAATFDATNAARHTRVRRWDQAGPPVDAGGGVMTIPAPAAPVVLEDGVQITFGTDPAGGDLHAGDYWVFAARTVDASVEQLLDEPPRGIHHHFCQLAIVTFPDSVTDCRTLWPPELGGDSCDCTVCVSADSHATGTLTIQMAIDRVAAEGGKICLGPGVYRLDQDLRIVGARSLRIQGKGWKTMLVASGRTAAIGITRSLGVTISDLMVLVAPSRAARSAGGTALALLNTIGTTIERCVLLQSAFVQRGAVVLGGDNPSFGAALEALKGGGGPLLGLDGVCARTTVRDNVIVGTTGIGPLRTTGPDDLHELRPMDTGQPVRLPADDDDERRRYLFTVHLLVEDNLLACARTGVSLEGYSVQAGDTRVAGNSLIGCRRGGIVCTGMTAGGSRLDVEGNLVQTYGAGIAAGGDEARVASNDVVGHRRRGRQVAAPLGDVAANWQTSGDGIVIAPSIRPGAIDHCQVLANRVLGRGGDGIALRTRVASAMVKQNVVEDVDGLGIVTADEAAAAILTIENNQLLEVGAGRDDEKAPKAGIRVVGADELAVVANSVMGVGRFAVAGKMRSGIEVIGSSSVRLAGNQVVDVGGPEFVGSAAGIGVFGAFERLDVNDNTVRRSRDRPEDPGRAEWFALLVPGRPDLRRLIGGALLASAGRARLPRPIGRGVREARDRAHLSVQGNLLEAYGRAATVLIVTQGACLFGGNRCLLTATGEDIPTARITSGDAIVGQNYFEGPGKVVAVDLRLADAGRLTAIGNISSGPIQVGGAPLAAPWDALNVP
jgi:uncharacterized protein DUF6519